MPNITTIVLAAGRSTRFGPPDAHKLLALVDGVPLVRRAVAAAIEAAVGDVVIVTGAEAARVQDALTGMEARVVFEPAFAEGIAASLGGGLRALDPETDAAIVALGDQPTVRPEAYRRLERAWAETGAAIVVPRYADQRGPAHPVLFAASTFVELRALRGDVGAREVIARAPERVTTVHLHWEAPRDVDTTDDLATIVAEIGASRRSGAAGASERA